MSGIARRRSSTSRGAASKGLLAGVAALGAVIVVLAIFFALRGPSEDSVVPASSPAGPTAQVDASVVVADAAPTAAEAEAQQSVDTEKAPVAAQEVTPEATPEAAPKPVEVWTGRVTSAATREPVEGATLSLASLDSFANFMGIGERPRAQATAVSNEDGRYTIEIFEKRKNALPMAMIIAEANGYATETIMTTHMLASASEMTADFELEAGGTVSGWVMDQEDKPVMDASVGSISLTQPAMGGMVQSFHSAWATSTGSGAFELVGVPVGESLRIPARAEGYMAGLSNAVEAGVSDLRIVLRKGGGTLLGRVLDESGKGIGGMQVAGYLQSAAESMDMQAMMAGMQAATTDEEGGFRFSGMAAGDWMLQAMDMAGGTGMMGPERMKMQTVSMTDGQETTVTITFEAPLLVRGRAIDADTREGIAGVRISSQPYYTWDMSGTMKEAEEMKDRKEVLTDAEGNFEIGVPNNGMGMAQAHYRTPEGYMADTMQMEGVHYMQVPDASKELPTVELRFRRGTRVTGRVLARDGATPVPGEPVLLRNAGGGPNRVGPMTDGEGRFSFVSEPGASPELLVKAEAGWAAEEVTVPAQGEAREVEMVLLPYSSISGKVTNGQGEPQAGFGALANAEKWAPQFVMPNTAGAKTDEKGYYFVEKVAGETVLVTLAVPEGSELTAPEPKTVTLRPGETKEGVDFVLGEGDFIEGVVTNTDGEPLEGSNVSWNIWDGTPQFGPRNVQTDEDGYYRIAGLKPGAVVNSITASHDGYQSDSRQNVSLLDGPQNFELAPVGEIELTAVEKGSGKPVANYDYLLYPRAWDQNVDPGTLRGRVRNAEGTTTFAVNGSGGKRVVVAELDEAGEPTGRKGAALFTVPRDGEPLEVEVEVGGGATITGRVIMDDTEEAVEGATVGIFVRDLNYGPFQRTTIPDAFRHRSATTDSGGEFEMPGMVIGTYELTAAAEKASALERIEVVVEEDTQPPHVTIRLGRSAAIFGVATDRDRQPLAGATVSYYKQSDWQDTSVTTNAEGEYRIEDLGPGQYSVSIHAGTRNLSESQSVELASGEEKELNFDFADTIKLTGRITVDGEPWTGQALYFYMTPKSGQTSGANLVSKGNGTYEAYPRAGTWGLNANSNTGQLGQAETFELPAEPREQTRDFAIATTSADVFIDIPEGVEFTEGWVTLQQKFGEDFVHGLNVQMTSPQRHVPRLVVGTYKGQYNGNGLTGESEPVEIAPGNDNVIVVFADASENEQSELARAQELLNELGYDSGPVDGIMGPMTRGALRRFQEENGLEPTGEPNGETMTLLEELAGG